jgi:hypothetical protein
MITGRVWRGVKIGRDFYQGHLGLFFAGAAFIERAAGNVARMPISWDDAITCAAFSTALSHFLLPAWTA